MTPEEYGLLDTGLKLLLATAAVASAFLAWRTKKAVQEVHVSLNSRLTQLLELTATASRAEGREAAKQDAVGEAE